MIVSESGAENVSHEGLHCGERKFRRYAYGVNGSWQELAGSSWQPLKGGGVYGYRKEFYRDYMCDPVNPVTHVRQILVKFRSAWDPNPD